MVGSFIAIGVCTEESRETGMPGWSRGSWGYHGDDGELYGEKKTVSNYGPSYGTGDVVGCGINLQPRVIFFTKNGKCLGKYSDY